jgi:hypothetical protein
MGVDFTAILDHRLSWEELYTLPRRLDSWRDPNFPEELRGRLREQIWRWRLDPRFSSVAEQIFDEGRVDLWGPCAFHAIVFKDAVEIHHLARWWSFVWEEHTRLALLDGTHQLANALRATQIIYLPDNAFPPSEASDLLWEGRPVADVVAWLSANIGAPARALDEMRRGDDGVDDRSYFAEPWKAG